MSLPNGFDTPYEYFHQVNEFLKQYSWIYREANTCFLKSGILNEMPQEYKDYFMEINTEDLNKFPYIHEPLINLNVESLKKFRHKLAELIPLEAFKEPNDMENSIKIENLKKMNIKKQHEIQRLATVVRDTLNLKEADNSKEKFLLIDFGSGLGYLSEVLYKLNENLIILGLEADTYRVEAAKKRLKTYMPNNKHSIQYRQQFITENSKDFIMKTVEEVFKLNYQSAAKQLTTKMIIIGLHACADLTITSMKLFLQMSHVQKLIIMPCCYHKLQVYEDDNLKASATAVNLKFKNFPLSESLKKVFLVRDDKVNVNDNENENDNYVRTNEAFTVYLNRPFLRLACQQTLKRWRNCSTLEHHVHGNEMYLRAVAESLKQTGAEKMELIVAKRRESKIDMTSLAPEQLKSFETFSRIYVLKSKDSNELLEWTQNHHKKFLEIMENYSNGDKLAEGLTCLQTSMQVHFAQLFIKVGIHRKSSRMSTPSIKTSIQLSEKLNYLYEFIKFSK